jgi:hypothetical protein
MYVILPEVLTNIISSGVLVFQLRKCLLHEDLQNSETGHPPAVCGFKTKEPNDGMIGTLSSNLNSAFATMQRLFICLENYRFVTCGSL